MLAPVGLDQGRVCRGRGGNTLNRRTPPTGGGTGPRQRSRYAPDAQVTRAAELALKLGMRLKLGADGSVEVLGRLDTAPGAAMAGAREETLDEALAAWEAGGGATRGA